LGQTLTQGLSADDEQMSMNKTTVIKNVATDDDHSSSEEEQVHMKRKADTDAKNLYFAKLLKERSLS
jgi:hypothetical protein